MSIATASLTALVLVTVASIGGIVLRPRITERRGGRVIALLAFFVLPTLATTLGVFAHLDRAKRTEFCLSCHVMKPYGESLLIDDADHLPAAHYQNRRTPRDQACYTCHTTYTMFGDYQAKLKGLQHVWVNYLGTIPAKLELYEPYHNRECLNCHAGARSFEENEIHIDDRQALGANEVSCLDCHDLTHDLDHQGEYSRWEEVP